MKLNYRFSSRLSQRGIRVLRKRIEACQNEGNMF
jgi:hypothetical protein